MAKYLGVKEVKQKGVLLKDWKYADFQPSIPPGYHLVAIAHNTLFEIAPDLTEFEAFIDYLYFSYLGFWGLRLYLLNENLCKECPDEGRTSISKEEFKRLEKDDIKRWEGWDNSHAKRLREEWKKFGDDLNSTF